MEICGGAETQNEKRIKKIINLLKHLLNQQSRARLLGAGATNKPSEDDRSSPQL